MNFLERSQNPFFAILFIVFSCAAPEEKASESNTIYYPSQDLGEVFQAIQMAKLFPDSKTFVDCQPNYPTSEIVAIYQEQKGSSDFNLLTFVDEQFSLPVNPPVKSFDASQVNWTEHLKDHWEYLTRKPDKQASNNSLLPLPNAYVVPGGRFREIYYWDSYFTMEGLVAAERTDLTKNMIDNFAFLIDTYGHIPNGNRSYYLSRPQPPFFAEMVKLWQHTQGDNAGQPFLNSLRKEYDFWMQKHEGIEYHKRTVQLGEFTLNRYWDDNTTPRPESYWEDVELAEGVADEDKPEFYRHIRAAAESGWDFTARWFVDGESMASINATHLLPVDLNSLMYNMESTLARLYLTSGDSIEMERFNMLAQMRQTVIQTLYWY